MAAKKKIISAKEVSNYLYSNYGVTLAQAKKLGKTSNQNQKLAAKQGIYDDSSKHPFIMRKDMKPAGASGKAERGRTVARMTKKKK